MDDAEFDGFIARASDPDLIAGIYNYCDRRCERCPFTVRCLQFRERRRPDAAREDEPIAVTVARSLERSLDMLRIIGRRLGIELGNDADDGPGTQVGRIRVRDARATGDALVERARHYAATVSPIAAALMPIVVMRGDPDLVDAVETIQSSAATIPARILRAVWSTAAAAGDGGEVQTDANGSAKSARLLVGEARRAWTVLLDRGQATADGVPARLVALLEEIDGGLAARFPRAMAFIRPGFDTERPAA
jgi:hypothetical protein